MLDYNFLKQVQRNERNSSLLSKLNDSFYEDCSLYFIGLVEGDLDELGVRLYRNAFSCYTEIVERRLEKIGRNVYFNVVRNYRLNDKPDVSLVCMEPPLNILDKELVVFKCLVQVYTVFYEDVYDMYCLLSEE